MKCFIEPFIGVNEFKFGMSKTDIETIMGVEMKCEKISEDIVKYLYFRNGISFTFEKSKLVEMSFIDIDIFLEDNNILKTPDIVEIFNKKYKSIERVGYTIYEELGIALVGFNPMEDYKTITVFQKGYWDDIITAK